MPSLVVGLLRFSPEDRSWIERQASADPDVSFAFTAPPAPGAVPEPPRSSPGPTGAVPEPCGSSPPPYAFAPSDSPDPGTIPHVVVLSLRSSEGKAAALVEECRSEYPHAPLVVMGGQEDASSLDEAYRAGAVDHIRTDLAGGDSVSRALRHALQMDALRHSLSSAANEERWLLALDGAGHDITERKEAEAALRASRAPLEQWAVPRALRGEAVSNAVYTLRRKDTGESWADSYSFAPIRDKDGTITGSVVVGRDITEQKPADEAIRESEQRFRTLVENAPDAIFIQTEGRFAYVNNAAVRLFGVSSAEELLGTPVEELFPPERRVTIRDRIQTLNQSRQAAPPLDYTIVTRSGEERYLSISAVPFRFQDQDGALVFARDVADRKRAETALLERIELQDQISRIASTVPGMIYAFRRCPDGTMCMPFSTGAILDIFGVRPEDVRKDFSPAWEMIHPEDRAGVAGSIAESARSMQAWRAAFRVRHPRRGERLLEAHSVPRPEPDGSVLWTGFVHDVTERHQAAQAIREITGRQQTLVETTFDWIWEVDAEGRYTYCSPKVEGLLGYAPAEVIGRTPFDFMPPAEAERVGKVFSDLARERRPFSSLENLNLHKDGREVYLETSGAPILGPEGELLGYRGADRDITVRKRAEEELRQREATLHDKVAALESLAEISREMMASTGWQGTLDLVCRRAAELLHAPKAVILTWGHAGTCVLAASHGLADRSRAALDVAGDTDVAGPEYFAREGILSTLPSALEAGGTLIGMLLVHDHRPREWDGSERQLLELLARQAAVIFEKARLDGELAQHAATLEQRIEERTNEIRRAQARTQAILDALGEGVIVTDLSGRIEYLNRAMEALSGYTSAEAAGKTPAIWRTGLSAEATADLWKTVLRGKTWRGEVVNRRRKGRTYCADITIAPIRNPDNPSKVAGFAAAVRDISLRKKAEEDIIRALERERELGDLRSRFVSMTSHEFRTPLSTILSSTDLLEHYGPSWPEERRRTHLHRIRSAVTMMTHLLNDVLNYGKVDTLRAVRADGVVDVARICREILGEPRLGAGPDHILEFACDEGAVEAAVDERLLRQILTNLLSNAIKYSPRGGPVRLELKADPEELRFTVVDGGIGIPPEAQPRVFEEFHRADNVGAIPGTGLGLSIARKSVELHGGRITLRSEVGQGTRMVFSLPRRKAA